MAFRLELSDLPPRYRAQAEAQLAKGRKKRSDPLAEAARAAKITGKEFDSLGEYEYYIGTVAPKVARGEIVEWEAHPCFPPVPGGTIRGFEAAPGSVYCGLPVGLCRRNRGDRGDQEQVCPADAAGLCPAAAGIPGTGGPPGWMEIHGDHNSG